MPQEPGDQERNIGAQLPAAATEFKTGAPVEYVLDRLLYD